VEATVPASREAEATGEGSETLESEENPQRLRDLKDNPRRFSNQLPYRAPLRQLPQRIVGGVDGTRRFSAMTWEVVAMMILKSK
jgi:hypothetical protein